MMNTKVIVVLLLVAAIADQSMVEGKKCKRKELCAKIDALDSKISEVSSECEAKDGDLQSQIDELSEKVKNLENPQKPVEKSCDGPFVQFESSCYLFLSSVDQFFNGANTCKTKYGARLLSIKSKEEEEFVIKHLKGTTWLGMTDLGEEGKWKWGGGIPVTYTNWNAGEPNGKTQENIGSTYKNGKWNDTNRYQKYFIACKKEAH